MTWTARATDDFNRADGGLGSDWTALNGTTFPALAIVSNQVRAGTGGANRNGGYYSTVQPRSAQYAKITLRDNLSTGDEAGLLLRCRNYTGGFDVYRFSMIGGATATAQIDRITNAASVTLKQILSLSNPVSGDVLMFTAEGNSLIGYVNGAPVIAIGTDATWHSGYAGILILSNTGNVANLDLDDFEMGDLDFSRGF